MRLRWALILIAVLPLMLASAAVAWMVKQRSQVLAELQLKAVEPVLLAARKAELQSYVNLARSSIAYLVRDGMPDPKAQEQALANLKRLEFGHDGYFFVLDFDGNTLLYPRQPQLQGRNLRDLQDRDGGYPISRDDLYQKLKDNDIHPRRYFYPLISDFPMYRGLPSAQRANLPIATMAAQQVLCLPIYPDLDLSVVDEIAHIIKSQ